MEQWWAIAHSTENAVRVCDVCHKILETITLQEAYDKGYIKSWDDLLKEHKKKHES